MMLTNLTVHHRLWSRTRELGLERPANVLPESFLLSRSCMVIKLDRHHYHNPYILWFCIYSEFDSKFHNIFAKCAIPFLCVHFFSCTPYCVFCVADRCIIFRCTIVHSCGAIVQCRLGNDWYRLSILPSAMAYPALPLSVCCLFRRNNKFVTFSFSSFSPIQTHRVIFIPRP